MIVAVANRKGGVGKTTASVFLAHALTEATGQPCALIDADRQASAVQWAQLAADSEHPLSVPVLAQPSPRLTRMMSIAPNVVIDTPPGDAQIVAAAIAAADLVLVPTSSSALDLSRVRLVVEAAGRSGKPAAVLLTRTRRTRSVATAEQSLNTAGVHVLHTHIPLREALAMAFGRPVRDLHGFDLAAAELLGLLPEQPYTVEAVRQRTARASAQPQPLPPHPQHAASRGRHRSAQPALETMGQSDDEIIERLKTSMARLAAQK